MPNKRVYLISIFRFFPTLLALFSPSLICKFSTLLVYWALFSTLLIYLVILFYEIYLKYPPYSFIWPHSYNWHLRILNERLNFPSQLLVFKKTIIIRFLNLVPSQRLKTQFELQMLNISSSAWDSLSFQRAN